MPREFHLELKDFLEPGTPVFDIGRKDVLTCKRTEKIKNVVDVLLNDKGNRRVPVLGAKIPHFHGFVTSKEIVDFLGAGPSAKRFRNINSQVGGITSVDAPALGKKHDVSKALELFHKHRKSAYPILHQNRFIGMVTEADIIRHIDRELGIRVSEIMTGRPIVARGDWPVFDVARMLCRGAFKRLPVAEKGILTGIVTTYDILRYLKDSKKLERLPFDKTPVKNVMNRDVVTIEPDADSFTAVKLMRESNVSALPVVEDGELVGIVTERDILNLFKN